MSPRVQRLSAAAICMFLPACASYTDQVREIRTALYSERYAEALEKLDKSSVATSSSDRVLYRLERGTLLYCSEQYSQAATEWDRASKEMDRLYTISLSKQAGSLLMNDSVTDYEGETHEKVLVPVFSALAYLAKGETQEAIVEARRTARILEKINEDNDGKNVYNRDSFAHYLSGIIFEMKEDWDSAIIEYKRALAASEDNRRWAQRLANEPIVQALGRLAEFRRRDDILSKLRKEYPGTKWQDQEEFSKKGEIIVVYESGKSPLKVPEDVLVPFNKQVMRISFPKFVDQHYFSREAKVLVNGNVVGRTTVVQDVGALAKRALEDRRGRDLLRFAARAALKAGTTDALQQKSPIAGLLFNVYSVASEVADTRSWSSLPDTIQVFRTQVPAGERLRVRIQPDAGKPAEETIELRPGEKRLLRLRTFL